MNFILVHLTRDGSDGRPAWLRADSIQAVTPKEDQTLLFTSQSQVLRVKESVTAVLDAIRRADDDR